MSSKSEQHVERYRLIRQNPRFIAMARARSRITWLLSALVLAVYALFMALAACLPQVLHVPLYAGSHLTWGFPSGASVILVTWLMTGWYVYRANNLYDNLIEQIVKESKP